MCLIRWCQSQTLGTSNLLQNSVQVHDNTNGSSDINYEYTETETNTVTQDVTITNSVSVSLETAVEVEGFSIKISSTYEHTTVSGSAL